MMVLVVLMVLSAILSNFIAPTNPFDAASLNLMNGFTAPMEPNAFTGEKFLLGTDDQGRDLFSAILFGLRVSLCVGLMAVGLAMVLGVLLGAPLDGASFWGASFGNGSSEHFGGAPAACLRPLPSSTAGSARCPP